MAAVYIESSALLAWMFGEDRAGEIAGKLDEAGTVVTSSLTLIEAGRALLRVGGEGGAKEGALAGARAKLARVRASWTVFAISRAIEERAAQPFPREAVRTLDAIHLATALECARIFDDLTVLSLDRRILENAEALGLA